jgi:hypothetical protein
MTPLDAAIVRISHKLVQTEEAFAQAVERIKELERENANLRQTRATGRAEQPETD